MNTYFRGAKPLFIAIFLTVVLVASPVQAQTTATSEQIDDLKSTLIALLTQMIAQLQVQLQEVLAQQAQTQEAVATVQTQVNSVVQNTTPVVGAQPTLPSLDASAACESGLPVLSVTISGDYDRAYFTQHPSGRESGSYFKGNRKFNLDTSMADFFVKVVGPMSASDVNMDDNLLIPATVGKTPICK